MLTGVANPAPNLEEIESLLSHLTDAGDLPTVPLKWQNLRLQGLLAACTSITGPA